MHSCLAFVDQLRLLNSHLLSWGQASSVNLNVCATAIGSLDMLSQRGVSGGQERGPGLVKGHWKGHPVELGSKADLGSKAVGWDRGQNPVPTPSKLRNCCQVSNRGVLSGQ